MSKKVYIAGPITGVKDFEKNFRRAARLLRAQGFDPVDPTGPGQVEGASYKFYIDRGLGLLEGCEFICMLPGSDKSAGAQLELHYAVTCGLPVMQVAPDYSGILGAEMRSSYETG